MILLLSTLTACEMPVTCDTPGELVAPVQESPAMWEVVDSLTPTLSWSNPGDCNPDRYLLKLYYMGGESGHNTDGPSLSYTMASPLEPGTEYAWTVQPRLDSSFGPIAGRNYFFTGPMCDTSTLVAPNLLEPANGAIINDDYPSLKWDYPDPCLPPSYAVFLSTDPSFTDTSLNGGTGNPSTRWGPGDHLDDCTEYFWRVAPWYGTEIGPLSTTYSFYVDESSSCFFVAEPSITIVDISGIVFHDMCPIDPGGLIPTSLPKGCAEDEWGEVHADGIHQVDEPGIEGIVVELGTGPCPSSGLDTTVTDAKGFYSFKAQTPGEYCISVNAEDPINAPILLSGQWTLIPSGHMGFTYRHITPEAGEDKTKQDFGWDYAGSLAPCPFFKLDSDAFCRAGPSQAFHEVTIGAEGASLPVAGRIQDNSWLLVQMGDISCWVSEVVGSTECDLSEVPVLNPPDPTRVPQPEEEEEPYCTQFTNEKDCNAHSNDGCKWNRQTQHCDGN